MANQQKEITKSKKTQKNNRKSLVFLTDILKQYVNKIYFYSFFSNLFILTIPVFFVLVFDKFLANQKLFMIGMLIIGTSFLFSLISSFFKMYNFNMLFKTFLKEINEKIFDKIFSMPYKVVEKKKKSFWIALFKDLDLIRNFLNVSFYSVKIDVLFLAISLGLIIGILKLSGFFVVFVLMLYVLLLYFKDKQEKNIFEKEKWIVKNRDDMIADTVYNISAMKSMFLESKVKSLWLGYQNTISDRSFRKNKKNNFFSVLSGFIYILSFILLIVFIGLGIRNTSVTFGETVALFFIFWYASKLFNNIESFLFSHNHIKNSISRISELFLFSDSSEDGLFNKDMSSNVIGKNEPIILENVLLQKGSKKILENTSISFDFGNLYVFRDEKNQLDTLFKSILGLYNILSGDMFLLSRNLKQYSKDDISSFVRYVPEESFLLDGSIRDNLNCHLNPLSNNLVRDNEKFISIEKASEYFGLNSIVRDYPEEYETRITDDSVLKSDVRLINISRAFVGNPKIVLIEFPFKNLSQDEIVKIINSFNELKKDILILIISNSEFFNSENAEILKLENSQIIPAFEEARNVKTASVEKISHYKTSSKFSDDADTKNKDNENNNGAGKSTFRKIKGAFFRKVKPKK